MKLQLILALVVALSQIALAQSHPYEVKFSYQIESELAEEKIRSSRAGLLYSLIGDYHNSNQYSDIPISWGVDSLSVENYSMQNALRKIVEVAEKKQIVIISENHLKPQHRIFASEVITELAKIGFEHLGLETFTNISNSNTLLDSILSERGYPLNSPLTGTYTLESQMGNLVRNAIKSNLKLFAYERSQKIEGKDRDEIQADNIIKYLEFNPKARIIIVCGFHHAIESNIVKRGNSFWMAKYLKEKIGIDPLTIYQDNFTEKFIESEHLLLKNIKVDEPSVFVHKTGQIVSITENVDIEVIHPKTIYVDGRPNWLFNSNKPVKVNLESFDINFPIIVSAFLIDEVNSVPIDRIELKHKYDNKALALKTGEYRIAIYDGEITKEYNQTVK